MNISEIEIRTAGIDDLAEIFHLGETLFTPRNGTNLYRTWDEYEITSVYNTEPELLLVAVEKEHIAGFAIGTVIEKPRSAWNYGYLVWLGVDPDYKRCGIGKRLFDHFRAIVEDHGVRMLMVDTQADNEAAVRFFTSLGFGNPTDHVYMTLNLQRES